MYINQSKDQTNYTWNGSKLLILLANVEHLRGRLVGKTENLDPKLKKEAMLSAFTLDVFKNIELEGKVPVKEQVYSSVARKLGLEVPDAVDSSKNIDGVADMMFNVKRNYAQAISNKRLFRWHEALFPTRCSGLYKLEVGRYRSDDMLVAITPAGKEKIRYEKLKADQIESEMHAFLEWFDGESEPNPVIKAAIAHLWFATIRPFDGGNEGIARAIADVQLARGGEDSQCFYSLTNQIAEERKKYYEILEKTQRGTNDITDWLVWFLACLGRALAEGVARVDFVQAKAKFWEKHGQTPLNKRQRVMLNKLWGWDGFNGRLSSPNWAKTAKIAHGTAVRDIQDLVAKEILRKETCGGGRSSNYVLVTE
jgi:Fic family protein